MIRRGRGVALALIVGTGSCVRDSGTSASLERSDSAGVEIVTNRSGAWSDETRWRLVSTPAVSIGQQEGADEEQLFRVVGAARLSDGRIVVANSGSGQLRFYDPAGVHIKSVGGLGDGPGEFRGMGVLRVSDRDSLWVYDWRANRVSVFDRDGKFARSFSVAQVGSSGFLSFVGRFGDGPALLATRHSYSAERDASGVNRPPQTLFRMDVEGSLVDTIGEFPGTESYVETDGSTLSVMSYRFARDAVLTTVGDGFYFSSTDESDVGFYSLDGDLQRVARLARPHRPVTAADVERLKEERMEGMPEGLRQMTQAMLDNLPFPETMPSFSEIIVDAEGNLWAMDYQAWSTDPPRWFVFDPTGRLLGELSMPLGFQVHQIGSNYVLGHRTDDLGVEYVEFHRLEKG